MPDYDFSGLSSRSFEKMVQALCVKVFGPGLKVFGDGPDGGREASYTGSIRVNAARDNWNGYCVVQAKFLQNPRNSALDGIWLLKRVEEELKAFKRKRSKRAKPDYYIIATNVSASSNALVGVKDKVAALVAKYHSGVPIKDHVVWDYHQLCALIDSDEAVRRAYTAWITPGDVLASVMQWLKPKQPDFVETIHSFLAKEFAADQYAQLEQAGQTNDEKIRLAGVFVDVPVSDSQLLEPLSEDSDDPPLMFAAYAVRAAKERLDPESRAALMVADEETAAGDAVGQIVLVGGPGQGKTTVGQFICQLFRAALLAGRKATLLSAQVRDQLSQFCDACAKQKIVLPKSRRFPIRVVLNEYAAALSASPPDRPLSLLSFFVNRISSRTDRKISPDDFREWMRSYPWLLVLDGLDEVPASSNRDSVLREIDDFWTEAAACGADLLVIATTRPQGYNGDFSPNYYRHLWLVPLSVRDAMGYAERLAETKFPEDRPRQVDILTKVREATTHQTTARLMRSPLQVTIMFTVIEHGGIPPQDRWRLFDEYYRTIYRREKQRPIPAAQLLRDYEKNIDIIHGRVALLLQVQSESSGGSEAKLDRARLSQIVDDQLIEEGFKGESRNSLRERILDAAENRLVFLVGVQEGHVGFEITSLREFMAAQSLFEGEGGNEEVQIRLEAIAPVMSWRNVFLFGAGRCFAEQKRRDSICTICEKMNASLGGEGARLLRSGSVLALELLEDGMAARAPIYRDLLIARALTVIDLPASEVQIRLSRFCDADSYERFLTRLESDLQIADFQEQLSAWTVLLAVLPRLRDAGAKQLAQRFWPSDPLQVLEISRLPSAPLAREWLIPKLVASVLNAPPRHAFGRLSSRWWYANVPPSIRPAWWDVAVAYASLDIHIGGRFDVRFQLGYEQAGSPGASLSMYSIFNLGRLGGVRNLPHGHSGWLPLKLLDEFVAAPSKSTLSAYLSRLLDADALGDAKAYSKALPWPVAAVVKGLASVDELKEAEKLAGIGRFGDYDSWSRAEQRFRTVGISRDDILYMEDNRWPIDAEIGLIGFPISLRYVRPPGESPAREGFINAILELRHLSIGERCNAWLDHCIKLALSADRIEPKAIKPPISIDFLRGFCTFADDWIPSGLFRLALGKLPDSDELTRWVDSLGRHPRLNVPFLSDGEADRLSNWFNLNPQLHGVARILALQCTRRHKYALPGVTINPLTMPLDLMISGLVLQMARLGPDVFACTGWESKILELVRERPADLYLLLQMISEIQLFDENAEAMILKIASELKGPRDAIDRAFGVLTDCFRRRRTRLSNAAEWTRLALPPSLLRLLQGP
ncbi:MAG TPA: hypothetical protein VFE47_19500 [Tepidisphaeraceae bacterium]|jgi:hypothetical protein|nr:hypothetical protein [Tepidisphaeraceae bacterium]